MSIEMGMDTTPKPPIAGIIFGRITYWLAIAGVIIALAGLAIYLTRGGYLNETSLLQDLWGGDFVQVIWAKCAGTAEVPHGFWYLGRLAQGDCLAMLGIAIACIAGVIGMWGAVFGMLRSRGGIYIIFALIAAVILSLSASGMITM